MNAKYVSRFFRDFFGIPRICHPDPQDFGIFSKKNLRDRDFKNPIAKPPVVRIMERGVVIRVLHISVKNVIWVVAGGGSFSSFPDAVISKNSGCFIELQKK